MSSGTATATAPVSIVALAADYAKAAVGNNDASHDWTHLERVLATAKVIT